MKATYLFGIAAILMMTGCSTDRVSTEFGNLSKAVEQSSAKINPRLAAGLAQDRRDEIRIAAENGDLWFLSDDCARVLRPDPSAALEDCTIIRQAAGDRPPHIGPARQLQRQLGVLRIYVTALDALSNAGLEADVNENYGVALAALGKLNTTLDSQSLADFLKARLANKGKADAAVSKAVEALRYRRMKSVVLASDSSVTSLVGEIQRVMIELRFDPDFEARVEALRTVEDNMLLADPEGDVDAYHAALLALEAEHARFTKYYQTTLLYEVGLIAQVHSALAAAMRSRGSRDDIFDYVKSLQALAKKLGA